MTTQASIPLKYYIPFAQGDGARVEIPVTTADPTRASQTLGFPPLTMQPPESGGVAPQGEDFNGAMNQVARIAWWMMLGGGAMPYDATFATNAAINGYPNGAVLQSADFRGQWINTSDNNQINPDTVGTGWVPGFQYGVTAITGLTNVNVTLSPAQASKNSITFAGTLTGNVQIILPNWIKNWTVTNLTTGAFTLIVKTAAGSGVVIPQNATLTRISGDGTNINQPTENVAAASSPTHATPMSQASGIAGLARKLTALQGSASSSILITADEIIVETANGGTRYCLANVSTTLNVAGTGLNGMDTGAAPVSGYVGVYAIYNPATGVSGWLAQVSGGAALSSVYSGGNAPSGFTASGLVCVLPTNGSGQINTCAVNDRQTALVAPNLLVSTTNTSGVLTVVNTAVLPANARRVGGLLSITSTSAANLGLSVAGNTNSIGVQSAQGVISSPSQPIASNYVMNVISLRAFAYATSVSAGTCTATVTMAWFEI